MTACASNYPGHNVGEMKARHAPEHPADAVPGEIVGTAGTWDRGHLITVRVGTEDRVYWSHGTGDRLAMNMAWYGSKVEVVESLDAIWFRHAGGCAWISVAKPGSQTSCTPL